MAGIYARAAVGPLQEGIRVALYLTDNQMASLQGPALALPLLILAVPLGLVIDRHSRARVMLIATMLNCIALTAAAMAPSFAFLLVARCIVGVAAPATAIAAYSLLADLYAPVQRGRATMIVVLGQVSGNAVAFALGGKLLVIYGAGPESWRLAMLGMSFLLVPVVLLALLVREPLRRSALMKRVSLRDTWPALWRYRGVIVILVAGMSMVNLADGAAMVWTAPTLARIFRLAPDITGATMAMALLTAGILGPLIGGALADFCQRRGGTRSTMSVMSGLALMSVAAGFFSIMPSVASVSMALTVFLTIGGALSVMTTTVAIVAIPNELRGVSVAVKFAAGAFFGLGLAPVAVSVLSDALGGPQTIGKALAFVCVTTSVLGVLAFGFGRRYFRGPAT